MVRVLVLVIGQGGRPAVTGSSWPLLYIGQLNLSRINYRALIAHTKELAYGLRLCILPRVSKITVVLDQPK